MERQKKGGEKKDEGEEKKKVVALCDPRNKNEEKQGGVLP